MPTHQFSFHLHDFFEIQLVVGTKRVDDDGDETDEFSRTALRHHEKPRPFAEWSEPRSQRNASQSHELEIDLFCKDAYRSSRD
jgi:hypothetical protein